MTVLTDHALPPRMGLGSLRPAVSAAARAALSALSSALSVLMSPHKASLARLWQMPLTAAAAGMLDYAGFQLPGAWGFVTAAISLVVLEHLISDGDDGRHA